MEAKQPWRCVCGGGEVCGGEGGGEGYGEGRNDMRKEERLSNVGEVEGHKGREDDACTCTSGEEWRDGEWSMECSVHAGE